MERQFTFSVIIPIYNVEAYLAEAIDSVIAQDIGFEEHIQLILVNDGSPDGSGEICLRYRDRYPGNIVYLQQENAGVSAARNHGMKYIRGRYVNFLDSDDKWAPNVFSMVRRFFEAKEKELDVVACKFEFFGARTGEHPLNYKFRDEQPARVIDLMNDYQDIQLSAPACFIKAEALEGYQFPEGLRHSEDSLMLNRILLRKRRLGALSRAIYYYRRRADESSTVQTQSTTAAWYTEPVCRFYPGIAEESIRLYGQVLPFIQHVIFYELGYRLKTPIWEGLSPTQREEYERQLALTLQRYVSDYVILNHNSHALDFKLLALRLKYGAEFSSHIRIYQQAVFFDGCRILDLRKSRSMLRIRSMELKKDQLCLEGVLRRSVLELLGEEVRLTFHTPGRKGVRAKLEPLPSPCYQDLYGAQPRYVSFRVRLPLDTEPRSYKAILSFLGLYRCRLALNYTPTCPIAGQPEHSYCAMGKYLLRTGSDELNISHPTDMKAALRVCREALEDELSAAGQAHLLPLRKKARLLRAWYRLTRTQLWLIADGPEQAGGSGEALFRYLRKVRPAGIRPVFVLSRTSPDYARLKAIGPVLDRASPRFLPCCLAAHRLLAGQEDPFAQEIFGPDADGLRDLFRRSYLPLSGDPSDPEALLAACKEAKPSLPPSLSSPL